MEFKEGVYENLPFSEYNEIPAYRASDLKEADKCLYSWKYRSKFTESPALLEGRVQHTVFLEHHTFDDEFIIQPALDRRTKVGKEAYEDFLATVGDRTPITQDMYDVCMERRRVAKDYIPSNANDKTELTVCYMLYGHPFKSRFDWYDGKQVWDLKTCRDASPRGFKQAINGYRYHMQASLYVDACKSIGLPVEGFSFLAQEKAHPYPYVVYTMSDEALEYGRAKNEQALHNLLQAEKSNVYKPYNVDGVQLIELHDLW
jgi:exodeoxyribonuclease VIII